MVIIEAVIKHFKLDDVREALEDIGIGGITVSEVLQAVAGRPAGRTFGVKEGPITLVPKIKIEMVVPDDLTLKTIEAICRHGSSGRTEDGRISVGSVETAVRIRTGEVNDEALTR